MNEPENPSASPRPAGGARDWLSPLVAAWVFLWILGLATVAVMAWVVGQFIMLSGTYPPGRVWFLVSIGIGLLAAVPLVPLALTWREPRYRAVFQSWALAAGYILALSPSHLPKLIDSQTTSLLQAAGAFVYLGLLLALVRARRSRGGPGLMTPSLDGLPLALLVVALLTAGWLVWGAFGSPLDALLNLAAGLALGFSAAVLLEVFMRRSLIPDPPAGPGSLAAAGFAVGTALLLMAIGQGLTGIHLLLLLTLPAMGWVVAVMWNLANSAGRKGAWLSVGLLVGLTASAPLVGVDPKELVFLLNLGGRDALAWAMAAALLGMVLAWAAGLGLYIAQRTRLRLRPGWSSVSMAAAALVASGLLYATAGQPGFHGERLFVILRDQADLGEVAGVAEAGERRALAYQSLVRHAESSQSGLRAELARRGVAYTPYYLVNALEVNLDPLARGWLEGRPEVDRVVDNPVLRPLPAPSPQASGDERTPPGGSLWNLDMVGAPRVWANFGVSGEGILVGQSDTGVEGDHPELAGAYRGRGGDHDYNWLDPWDGTREPTDRSGHGTHTLGIVLGETVGVAPGAEWIGCVNLARNLGNPARYLDCLQFMFAPYPQDGHPFRDGDPARGANVLNNSWGCPEIEGCDARTLLEAVQSLRTAGVFVVASAGNDGPRCSSLADPIALYDEVLSVGAIDQAGFLASFSSLGPVTVDGSNRVKPDLVAPGVDVWSAYPGNSYSRSSGTSMAGPHVVGVVALMWSANPGLIGDVEATTEILQRTAALYSGPLPNCPGSTEVPSTAVGYGVVDADPAVREALAYGR